MLASAPIGNAPAEWPPEVVGALSAEIVTFDGQRYYGYEIGGDCGASGATCLVEFIGNPADDRYGSDLHHFQVDLAAGTVEREGTVYDLSAFPPVYHEAIDQRVRRLRPAQLPAEALFDRAVWLPPPRYGTFIGLYLATQLALVRDGEIASACYHIDVTYDWPADRILDVQVRQDPEWC